VTAAKIAWFTGLSGAGKSTIAERAAELLTDRGQKVLILDGDAVRESLHRHLGFTPEDIRENNRLMVGLCQENQPDYDYILVPIISPFIDSRSQARNDLGDSFFEVHVSASFDEVRRRDPKGLYQKMSTGEITDLIGVGSGVPYEPPESPELALDTQRMDPENCAKTLADRLMTSRF
jgi:bifunctional enzyme CysN/CysC